MRRLSGAAVLILASACAAGALAGQGDGPDRWTTLTLPEGQSEGGLNLHLEFPATLDDAGAASAGGALPDSEPSPPIDWSRGSRDERQSTSDFLNGPQEGRPAYQDSEIAPLLFGSDLRRNF